ncbi:nuclear transport factor 2 family protein [Actinoplanes sp. NPDC049596]|uniref:nuclear transport factor 2 family protein n=1 Tax=unclassified Actinoplanes TaxID=2626549 RepID=UPI00344A6474
MFDSEVSRPSRRQILGGVLAAGGAVAAAPLLTSVPAAAQGLPATIFRTAPTVDVSHASAEVGKLVASYFHDKNAARPDATMAHFSRDPFAYLDAALGLSFATWQSLLDFFRQVMPTWTAQVRSYPVRILGDATSALVFFVESAGAFGPAEIRAAAAVNFRRGLIVRNVDYWDGRHFGLSNLAAAQLPKDQFPADWRESIVGETASPVIQRVSRRLNHAFATGAVDDAVALLAPDVLFEDEPAHLRLTGTAAVAGFLRRAGGDLPYAHAGVAVRHVVGSAEGGGFEWKSAGPVPRGLTALELGPDSKITRLTAVWDGALVDDAHLVRLQTASIEH